MGKLLCENFLRDVWCRNKSIRAEIGQILQTHTQTHASKLVVEMFNDWGIAGTSTADALVEMTHIWYD